METKASKQNNVLENENLVFQEVEVRRHHNKVETDEIVTDFEIVKILRPKVKITQAEADILNAGVYQDDRNKYFSMYLLPGTKRIPPKRRKIKNN